jgi:hypothetical protein
MLTRMQGKKQLSYTTVGNVSCYNCCGNVKLRYGTLKQFSRQQRFIVLAQAQPLDMVIPATFLGGSLPGLWKWWFVTSFVTRAIPLDCWEKIPLGINRHLDLEEGLILQWVGGRTTELVRHKNQQVAGRTAPQTGKNSSLNSDLPQGAEGETDHLPETTSYCLLGWNYVSQVQKKV